MNTNIPEHLKVYLGTYGACFYDSWCGEPVSWGYEVVKRVDNPEYWKELYNYGDLECSHGSFSRWFLVTKNLTREEAIEKYGEVTDEEYGVRGGFKSITFGDKRFISKRLSMKGLKND